MIEPDGFAGEAVSTRCLLISTNDWSNFNSVVSDVTEFKVQDLPILYDKK